MHLAKAACPLSARPPKLPQDCSWVVNGRSGCRASNSKFRHSAIGPQSGLIPRIILDRPFAELCLGLGIFCFRPSNAGGRIRASWLSRISSGARQGFGRACEASWLRSVSRQFSRTKFPPFLHRPPRAKPAQCIANSCLYLFVISAFHRLIPPPQVFSLYSVPCVPFLQVLRVISRAFQPLLIHGPAVVAVMFLQSCGITAQPSLGVQHVGGYRQAHD